jgi:hypothetical protein
MPNEAETARDDLLAAILTVLIAIAEKVSGERISVSVRTKDGDRRRIYPGIVE